MGKKNKKKAKQQKRIAKIIADGRVTKKEASKAQKKGISSPVFKRHRLVASNLVTYLASQGTSTPKPNASEVARGTYKAPAKPAYSPFGNSR